MKASWAVAPNAEQERNQNALRRKHTDQPELPESSRWTRSAVGARLNKGLVTAGELFLKAGEFTTLKSRGPLLEPYSQMQNPRFP